MTTEERKKALWSYAIWVKYRDSIQQEINELRRAQMSVSSHVSDGMPHGNAQQKDLSDYAAKLDEMMRKLASSQEACLNAMVRVQASVDALQDPREKLVMWLRYIRCMSWDDVSDEMGLEVRQVYRIHGQALKHIRI